jgi:glycosyltransferase involved in cell wall biosynthesis
VISHALDKFCAKESNETWNMTEKLMITRLKLRRDKRAGSVKERVVSPLFFSPLNIKETIGSRKAVMYIGRPKTLDDLLLVAKALSKFKGNLDLYVIGHSPCITKFKEQVEALGFQEHVFLLGYVPSENFCQMQVFQRALCGVAIFPGKGHLSNYTWPSKVLHSLENGLPVIISREACIASVIEENGLGLACDNSVESILQALEKLSINENKLFLKMRKNIVRFLTSIDRCHHLLDLIDELLKPQGKDRIRRQEVKI